jgi:hypothetical protein
MLDAENNLGREPGRKYTWPWWVLGAVLLGFALAVLWMSQEIARTRRIRDASAPAPATNQPAPAMPPR